MYGDVALAARPPVGMLEMSIKINDERPAALRYAQRFSIESSTCHHRWTRLCVEKRTEDVLPGEDRDLQEPMRIIWSHMC